jgi:hypothetical protein
VLDIGIASTFAIGGFAMSALPVWAVAVVLLAAVGFAFALDLVKVPVFAYLQIAESPAHYPLTVAAPGVAKTTAPPIMTLGAGQPKATASNPKGAV